MSLTHDLQLHKIHINLQHRSSIIFEGRNRVSKLSRSAQRRMPRFQIAMMPIGTSMLLVKDDQDNLLLHGPVNRFSALVYHLIIY